MARNLEKRVILGMRAYDRHQLPIHERPEMNGRYIQRIPAGFPRLGGPKHPISKRQSLFGRDHPYLHNTFIRARALSAHARSISLSSSRLYDAISDISELFRSVLVRIHIQGKPKSSFFLALGLTLCLTANAFGDVSASLKAKLLAAGLSPRSLDIMEQKLQSEHDVKQDVFAIVDYTLPSDQPRFFVINTQDDSFTAYHVAHGTGSGGRYATSFSNRPGSNKSSLGFMVTGAPYQGKFGSALVLRGISQSNSNIGGRTIIVHSAEYSSQRFLNQNGFWGRSFGCLAVPQTDIDSIINSLGSRALILAYHDKLWDQIQQNSEDQSLENQPPPPPATRWETIENKNGDLPAYRHKPGDPPTTYYSTFSSPGASRPNNAGVTENVTPALGAPAATAPANDQPANDSTLH